MKTNLKKQLNNLPNTPGVYIFKSRYGKVLYVGKAIHLRKRVNYYFKHSYTRGKLIQLVNNISKIDFIVTSNEAEALLVENRLIKQEKPKYNVMHKDDKSYPLVEITNEMFPRIYITRGKHKKDSLYLGPFTNAKLLRKGLKYLRRIIPFRTCRSLPDKVCLNYDLSLCPGPCEDKITPEKYSEFIDKIKLYLQGKKNELIKSLKQEMYQLSEKKKYEMAVVVRDRIKALSRIAKEIDLTGITALLYRVKQKLELINIPDYIEAFDISNIYGKQAVGSMVAFKHGCPYKQAYRRFKIKNISNLPEIEIGGDDYRMMKEVLYRRYSRVKRENKRLPDLVVIDGGKGHLNVALRTLKELDMGKVDVIAIAKKFDFIFHKKKDRIVKYELEFEELKILQRIRDESHRFAKSYYHILRGKLTEVSELDNIPGIGSKRKKALLRCFGSIKDIKKANEVKLLKVKNISPVIASKIKDYFK